MPPRRLVRNPRRSPNSAPLPTAATADVVHIPRRRLTSPLRSSPQRQRRNVSANARINSYPPRPVAVPNLLLQRRSASRGSSVDAIDVSSPRPPQRIQNQHLERQNNPLPLPQRQRRLSRGDDGTPPTRSLSQDGGGDGPRRRRNTQQEVFRFPTRTPIRNTSPTPIRPPLPLISFPQHYVPPTSPISNNRRIRRNPPNRPYPIPPEQNRDEFEKIVYPVNRSTPSNSSSPSTASTFVPRRTSSSSTFYVTRRTSSSSST